MPFQHVKDRFPEAARTFQSNMGHVQALKPLTHPQQIRHHRAKGPLLFLPLSLRVRSNGAYHHVSLVDINADTSLIHNVHSFPPRRMKRLHRQATGHQAWVKISPTCFPCGSDRRWCLRGIQITLLVRLVARMSSRSLTALRPAAIVPFFMRGGAPVAHATLLANTRNTTNPRDTLHISNNWFNGTSFSH